MKDVKKFETNNRDISINVFMIEEEDDGDDFDDEADNDADEEEEEDDDYYHEQAPRQQLRKQQQQQRPRRRRRRQTRKRIVPLYVTPCKRDRHANLLIVQHGNAYHFVCISSLSRLLSAQLSKRGHAVHVCERCLHYFHTEQKLYDHVVDCRDFKEARVILPQQQDRWLRFKDRGHQERVPFVVYADFECTLQSLEPPGGDTAAAAAATAPRMYPYQKHCAYSVGYLLKCARAPELDRYGARRDKDCAEWFANELLDIARLARETLNGCVAMHRLNEAEERLHETARNCHICKKPFLPWDVRVRDHDHITGRYRGPAHNACNLNYKDAAVIPVVFHNLSGYDAHLVIRAIANTFRGRVRVLPINKEKYISFTKYVPEYRVELRFVDSFKFMASSLDKLSSYLERENLKNLKSQFPDLDEASFELLTRKGIFPYDYIDNSAKLEETALPPREAFYNRLNDQDVSSDDYEHAQRVWTRFDVANLGEYSDIYLKTDVLLLADVFENFRDSCMRNYELDPAHYYTLPGFTWDAMLSHTGVRLELLTDVDMVLFVERGIRGGLSQCSHRRATANNKYMPPDRYDPSATSRYIMYFDVNNLYGWAMCEPMPSHGFQWMSDTEAVEFDATSVPVDSSEGYILEVDLEYPQELHDEHADLPFCPVRESPPGTNHDKLLATVCDKSRYVVHYRALQQCLRHGLVLRRVHRVLRFQQSAWLKTYIELNTRLRTAATNEFEKNMFKLMNNAVFGKTMENVRNRVNVKLITKWEGRGGAEAQISKPNFHSRAIFDENLVAVELLRLSVMLNKPIYVGMTVLDVSKTCLYEFHYDYVHRTFGRGDECRLLYTDTDSLIYDIAHEDVYAVMRADARECFDTSDYPADNVYGIPLVNKKVPGLMKDENNGKITTDFVGLRSKMYAMKISGCAKVTKKAKGVKNYVVQRHIEFDDYVECLEEFCEKTMRQNCIRSTRHNLFSVTEKKIALSPYDDKRFLVRGTHATLPWGHFRIMDVDDGDGSDDE